MRNPRGKIALPQLTGEKIEAGQLAVVKVQTLGGQDQAVAEEEDIAEHPQHQDRQDKQGMAPVESVPQMIIAGMTKRSGFRELVAHKSLLLLGTERKTGMTEVTENRADQDNRRGGELRGHSRQFNKDGEQDQTQNKTEKVCTSEADIFPEGRPPLLRRLEGDMLMEKKGIRNGQDAADHVGRHIGHIVGGEKTTEQGIQDKKNDIAEKGVPNAHNQKADLDLMPPP